MPTTSRRGFLASSLGAAAIARFAGAAASSELCALTLKQASDSIRSKKVSPVELTEACLDRIKTYNPKINAWITIMGEKALAQAKTLAEEQAAGKLRSPLHGIPIGVKDSIDAMGARATAASAVYEYRFPSEDAEVVRRLRAAGAVIVGKCNMHEFDAGASSAVSYWGPVRNPWNLERVSGGPSGGSAAAVARTPDASNRKTKEASGRMVAQTKNSPGRPPKSTIDLANSIRDIVTLSVPPAVSTSTVRWLL